MMQLDPFPDPVGDLRDQTPDRWAVLQLQMGDSLLFSSAGDRAENIERAIIAYERALEVMTPQNMPEGWARTVCRFSDAYLQRRSGDPAENTERATSICREALEAVAPNELADTLFHVAGRVTIEALGPPEGWADLFDQLGHAYMERIYGDRGENVEIALRAFRQALAWTDRQAEPVDWAAVANNIAILFGARLEGDPRENIRRKIHILREVVDVLATQSEKERWATAMKNLATAYLSVQGKKRTKSIELALSLYRQVLKVRTRRKDPIGWATTTVNLANAYLNRPGKDRTRSIEKAIQLYERALKDVLSKEGPSVIWAEALCNLGHAYHTRRKGRRSENVERAILLFRQVVGEVPPDSHTRFKRETLVNLADLYFAEGRWEEAHPVYAEALQIGLKLLETAVYEAGRWTEVYTHVDLHTRRAYCLLRLGKYGDALVQLEAGKTRLLALALALTAARLKTLDPGLREAIEEQRKSLRKLERSREEQKKIKTFREGLRELDSPGKRWRFGTKLEDSWFVAALATERVRLKKLLEQAHARRPNLNLTSLSLKEILAVMPENGALVAPIITSQGSAIFIVPAGVKRITQSHVLRLDGYTTANVKALLRGSKGQPGWLRVYNDAKTSPRALEQAIYTATAALWDQLVGQISERLLELKFRRVLFLPQRGLGLLPLHAAWRMMGGEQRYLSDDFEVVYAPSAYALDAARQRTVDQDSRIGLVAGVSHYERFEDLPYVGLEANAIADLFGTEPLLDAAVQAEIIIQKAQGANYLHLACHGAFAWESDPLASSLYLAGDAALSLAEIIGRLELKSARLVTLSACETGVVDVRKSPDEFFGLTAGFLQAGASGVVSSLWTVNDRSTALLMERFYRNHLEKCMKPAAALHEAQSWLRGLTRETLSEHLKALGRRSESREILSSGPKYERLYESPYYWAAFTYNGI